jgi:hypothetical protein
VTLTPGTVTISATDPRPASRTDLTGDDVTLTVIGRARAHHAQPVDRRPGARRRIQRYTATGHFGGGVHAEPDPGLYYASSDPRSRAAPNVEGDRESGRRASRRARVTISATHPTAGVSTTDTGDDAQLIVEP